MKRESKNIGGYYQDMTKNQSTSSKKLEGRLTLGIDVGTTATKVLLLSDDSSWQLHSWPSEEGLWNNLRKWLGNRGEKIDRVGITAHGPSVVVIRDNQIQERIINWFEPLPDECIREIQGEHILPNTRFWVPSRVAQWEKENGPIGDGIAVQLKDMYNWQLTGVIARDSRSMRGFAGEGYYKLPEEVIGTISQEGAILSGIRYKAEVICGCDDLTAGVIGLGANEGVLFNLANTTEHVGQVGGKCIKGMSWLPPIGRLPSLSYNATPSAKISLGLEVINQPIMKIRDQFPELEMWIGGGLANMPEIVSSRNSKFMAGSEVSALGIAKLAKLPKLAIIFGSGKVGRGFLAQLLMRSSWETILVDSHLPTVRELSQSKQWDIYNLSTQQFQKVKVKDVIHSTQKIDNLMLKSSLIMTSMGANYLEAWAHSIRSVLCKRLRNGPIDIITAENHPRPAELVRTTLLDGANHEERQLIGKNLGVSQAQVLRSCIEPTSSQPSMTVQIQNHWTLPMDGNALLTTPDVLGFEPMPDFERELTRKLFTYNCVNAMVSYIGYLKGYQWLSDAANDSKIAKIALQAGMESSAALVSAYRFDADDQEEWCRRALAKYQDESIRDTIERNARDPVRKLGKFERLLGPINLCKQEGLPYETLLIGVAAALRYPNAQIEEQISISAAEKKLDSFLCDESV